MVAPALGWRANDPWSVAPASESADARDGGDGGDGESFAEACSSHSDFRNCCGYSGTLGHLADNEFVSCEFVTIF